MGKIKYRVRKRTAGPKRQGVADLENGRTVSWPGWEVVRQIGTGSFGAVYEIQRNMFGTRESAALKVISLPRTQSDLDELYSEGYDRDSITLMLQQHLGEIYREYSLMNQMKGNTNIVCCDDFRYSQRPDGVGWDIYIKMELLTPLNQYLGQTIRQEQVIRLGMDICNALMLCRSRSIIHRDIKPQNIFVSRDGDYKLGDFGIAKTIEKTSGGTRIGTYRYMAPEVYNDRPYGHQADIYSLGMVLYWMLNERRGPFLPLGNRVPSAAVVGEADNRRFRGDPIPVPAHGSPELQRIVLRACAWDTAARYADAGEMLADLAALKEGTTVVEPEPPKPEPVKSYWTMGGDLL